MTRDARIDAYIADAPPFARPILDRIRAVVHAACPTIEETIKWGMPFFTYKGRLLGSMAAFKTHAALGLWRMGADGPARAAGGGMGQFGRMTSIADLPDDATLTALIHKAMAIIDAGPPPRLRKAARPELPLPDALAAALAANPAAQAVFDGFAPSHRRDYAEWIGEARQEATRTRRVAQAIDWIAAGKTRNWQYRR